MYIRFYDTGETFKIIGERRQFWLFRQTESQVGRAVKGADSYELILETDELKAQSADMDFSDITVRDEISPETDFDKEIGNEDS